MKIYLACGLTHVPRDRFKDYVAFIHALAARLGARGSHEVRYALRDSDPQLAERPAAERARLCYLWDRQMVEWADVVVAECSHPSTGVGIELQIAEQQGTPIVLSYRSTSDHQVQAVDYDNPDTGRHHLQIGEGYVTLMALGIPTVFRVVPYACDSQGLESIAAAVALIERPPTSTITAPHSDVGSATGSTTGPAQNDQPHGART